MKSCERCTSLLELVDKFTNTMRELTCEIHELNDRVSKLEKENDSIIEIDESVHKLQEVNSECNVGHK